MTSEEAIKLLKKFALRVKPVYETQRSEYPQAIDMAIEALKQEPKTGEWIPCSERLPEEREDYELATEQMEHDIMYEQTYNSEDGSM